MSKVLEGLLLTFQGLLGIVGALWWVWAIIFGLCILTQGCLYVRSMLTIIDDGASYYSDALVWMWTKTILIFSLVLLIIAGTIHFG